MLELLIVMQLFSIEPILSFVETKIRNVKLNSSIFA